MKFLSLTILILLFSFCVQANTNNSLLEQPELQIDTLGDKFMCLTVPSPCISEPNDSFQVMHSTPLFLPNGYMNNPSRWLVGSPLIDGSSLCEDPCIYVMDDSISFMDNLYNMNVWHELVDTLGSIIQNPVCSASFFDDPDGFCYAWATRAYGSYMSDPVLLLDKNNSPILISRVTRNVWYKEGFNSKSVSIHYIYAHKFNGMNWNDTTLLIDGYINNGSELNPQHSSMLLMAPSVWYDNEKYIAVVNEDTSANMTALAVWEGLSLDTKLDPTNTFNRSISEGNIENNDHYQIGILNWELPGFNFHRHTNITKLSDSLYIGFATPMSSKDTSWFGFSYDFENWLSFDEPILTGHGWLNQWIYTVHPLVTEETDFWQLFLFISGLGKNINQDDSPGWYTSMVNMKIFKGNSYQISGDVNHDQDVNIADIMYMVDYLFKGGALISPESIGDVNQTCSLDVSDIVFLVDFLFKGGPEPLVGCE